MTHAASFVAATILATGCGSTAPASQPVRSFRPASPAAPPLSVLTRAPIAQPSSVTDTRVIIDSALDRTLRLVNVISSTGRDGLLKIQVNVKNITDSPRWFSYQIEWFDKDGALLPGVSGEVLPWMLLAGETSSIVATAPAVTAKDFGVAFLAVAK